MNSTQDDEANRFSGRLARYARVGSGVGGLAAKMIGSRALGLEVDRAAQAADLARMLGGLKGPIMKVAQLIATIPDAVPPEYAIELAQLQADAPPMGWAFVKRRMTAELGPSWQSAVRRLRARPGGRRLAWPGASGDGQGRRDARLQAAISRHERRSKRTCGSCG